MAQLHARALAGFHQNRNQVRHTHKPGILQTPRSYGITQRLGAKSQAVLKEHKALNRNLSSSSELPVAAFRKSILKLLKLHGRLIISAETGAGKSTQICQYLNRAGYKAIIVTQPRRFAASTLASYVAEQQHTKVGDRVGFRHALEQSASARSEIVFTTDGYQLLRELQQPSNKQTVLIIDEVHERNAHTETLLAIEKSLLLINAADRPKIIVMSATINTARLSKYLRNAPVLEIPGRTYQVTEVARGATIASDAKNMAEKGLNSLVFLPGKSEILQMEQRLRKLGVDAEIIPLHAQQERFEQELALRSYGRPKIVLATNIAETSITIPDIDVIILSGLVRRAEVVDGVETLAIRSISQDEFRQQKGRAGRTKPGTFINHGKDYDELEGEKPPQIQNMHLDSLMLRLASVGRDIRRLPFLNMPTDESFKEAEFTLRNLGLMGSSGKVTEKGKAVSQFPVDARMGAMLYEACLQSIKLRDPSILSAVIDVVAVTEAEGVTKPLTKKRWLKLCADEVSSDHVAQMRIFNFASTLDPDSYNKFGIDPVGLRRAQDVRRMLCECFEKLGKDEKGITGRFMDELKTPDELTPGQRAAVIESIWKGLLDSAFRKGGNNEKGQPVYRSIRGGSGQRKLGRDSVINPSDLLVGRAIDIAVLTGEEGTKIVHLIPMATVMDPHWLQANKPAALKKEVHSAIKEVKARKHATKSYHKKFRRMENFMPGQGNGGQ